LSGFRALRTARRAADQTDGFSSLDALGALRRCREQTARDHHHHYERAPRPALNN